MFTKKNIAMPVYQAVAVTTADGLLPGAIVQDSKFGMCKVDAIIKIGNDTSMIHVTPCDDAKKKQYISCNIETYNTSKFTVYIDITK